MKRITMAEVAEAAGVNKATVSRALKGDRCISAATRQKVWDAARALGYEMNVLASGLSSRHSDLVGLMVESLSVSWIGTFLQGLHRVLSRHRMDLMLLEADGHDMVARNALRRFAGRRVDGLIFLGDFSLSAPLDIPAVHAGSVETAGDWSCQVLLDQESVEGSVVYPALELGILSARTLVNLIRLRGVRPRKVLVKPAVHTEMKESDSISRGRNTL